MDKDGNSYISCFFVKEDQKDHVLILKVNSKGIVEWEMGTESRGRATSIAINTKDQIFVTGFFTDELTLGNQSAHAKGDHIFIAEISPSGMCKNLITNQGNAMSFDISISDKGYVLIAGRFEGNVSFGSASLENNSKQTSGFLALFKPDKQCEWIKEFGGQITRIKNKDNVFYITGGFNETISFNADTLTTTGSYDNDGFLMALNAKDAKSRLVKFGTEGFIREGFRTREKGGDLAFNRKGNVIVAAIINESKLFKQASCKLFTFSASLDEISESTVTEGIDPSGVLTFASDENENFWLTGYGSIVPELTEKTYVASNYSHSFIMHLNNTLETNRIIKTKHEVNMGFRSSCFNNNRIVFSGHFNDSLSIGNKTIKSIGKHDLFIYSFCTQSK
jgi:hypothetical protein